MGNSAFNRLKALMEREKAILLTGGLLELETTNRDKEKLLEAIDFEDVDPEDMRSFFSMVTELYDLSGVALESFKSARTNFMALESARSKLSSYDAAGAPRMIETRVEDNIRRA